MFYVKIRGRAGQGGTLWTIFRGRGRGTDRRRLGADRLAAGAPPPTSAMRDEACHVRQPENGGVFTIIATLAYLGLGVIGEGGLAPFLSHPPLIAVAVVTLAMSRPGAVHQRELELRRA